MDLTGTSTSPTNDSSSGHTGENRVTPQLVKEIADMIYAMLLRELKIEEERQGLSKTQFHSQLGGKS